jgi:predicted MPP superfamily phosphohydrolase
MKKPALALICFLAASPGYAGTISSQTATDDSGWNILPESVNPAIYPAAGAASKGMVLNSTVNRGLGGKSFRFVQLTDLHIGEGMGDYGTEGFDDTAPAGDIGVSAQRLREAVNWINANKDPQNIAFVMITGDITDSAERSEFLKAKEILDTLTVPYIPMPGNHDIWPYTANGDAPAPVGD